MTLRGLLLLSPFLLAPLGCRSPGQTSPSDDGGTPDAGLPPWRLAGGKQGLSGGFVDVDGDGVDDKVVGAPLARLGESLGAVLVYPGTTGGYAAIPSLVLTGGDLLGSSFVTLGDVDGDGLREFAVGAIAADGPDTGLTGTVTVYRGGGRGAVLATVSAGSPAARFGYALAAGDVDGDGKPDLVVGCPFDTPTPALYQGGSVHVFLAPTFTVHRVVNASALHKGLGWAVAAGDINGDGVADLVLGASGEVLAWYGGHGFAPATDTPDVVVKSAATGFGRALAVLGDFDGDGKAELGLSAPNATIGGQRDTGSVYVVKGGAGARSLDLGATPPPPDLLVRLDGPGLFARFGAAVTQVGDADGDGKPDFVVGAPLADVETNELRGQVYLFKGKDFGPTTTLAGSTGFSGRDSSGGFGAFLAPGPKGELLIGGPRANQDTGSVSVVNLATGQAVPGGATGGSTGEGSCH